MARQTCWEILSNLNRKKAFQSEDEAYETPLRRSLTTFDLTMMGTGSMVGAGLYVLTGVVAKETTGPAVIVSYIIASVAALLAALCYSEFAGRIPRTGSAYTFTYMVLGEFFAFLVGWNLALEYVVASAAISRSFSGYFDSLCNNAISNFTVEYVMGGRLWDVPFIAPYPDLFAALVPLLLSLFVITGANISSRVTTIFLLINLLVVSIIVIMGFRYADIRNWQDYGGFAPYGVDGVFAGGATLFFSYVGFDIIAVSNEETINPKKSIPWATFYSLAITTLAYILSSASLTLMVPYTHLDESSAFSDAFLERGIQWARWVVGIGALCAMFSTNLMNVFALPRSIFAMARDGLLFSWLAIVNDKTRVPVVATLASLLLVVVTTLFFSLPQLVEFLSIGVLCAYTFVACALIILRYRPHGYTLNSEPEAIEMEEPLHKTDNVIEHGTNGKQTLSHSVRDDKEPLTGPPSCIPGTLKEQFRSLSLVKKFVDFPPGRAVLIGLLTSVVFQICAISLIEYGYRYLRAADWWAILLLCLFIVAALLSFLVIPLHYQVTVSPEYFSVTWVPLVPGLSILCNLVLALKLQAVSWIRFIIWIMIGLLIYVLYGYRHSREGQERERVINGEVRPEENDASYGSIATASAPSSCSD